MSLLYVWVAIAALAQQPAPPPAPGSSLDYDVFKTKIQPIFMKKRPGNARCYVCHSQGTTLRLERLAPGATMWNEEQSRKNFATIQRVVLPGVPAKSRLLTHPLAVEAGGDHFHAGGRHWQSQDDPEWKILADWVRGRS